MAEYTLDQVMTALRNAHEAGDTAGAQRLAQIANQMRNQPQAAPKKTVGQAVRGTMSQVNRGIADAAGGLVDLINPFDQPHALNPFPNGTGSARAGLTRAMEASGIDVAQGEPETFGQGLARGVGSAAVGALPAGAIAKGAEVAQGVPQVVNMIGRDASRALSTTGGFVAEAGAGGLSAGAMKAAENAGAPPWLAQTAAIAAPVGAVAAGQLASRISPTRAAVRFAGKTLAPFTTTGGRQVARNRLMELAGGPDRAAELSARTEGPNELGLTPAEMTRDPNMMGLQRLAMEQDPNLRARLEAREGRAEELARQQVRGTGDPARAQGFFEGRVKEFNNRLKGAVQSITERGRTSLEALASRQRPDQASEQTVAYIKSALDGELATEAELWGAIPEGTPYMPSRARSEAMDMIEQATQPWQQGALPRFIRDLAEGPETYTFKEIHSLYSDLRRQSRAAMAGTDQQKALARNANILADAILEDLGAFDPGVPYADQINEARAFSRALHETFDQGAVGRILNRTIDGDERIRPEEALRATVGRTGESSAADARQINAAAPQARPVIEDYLRGRFQNAATRPTTDGSLGEFDRASAARFMRDNSVLLEQYPELRETLINAARQNSRAEDVASAVARVIERPQSARQEALTQFIGTRPEEAVARVFRSDNPARAARLLRQEASRDETGEALAGLKGAFASQLIRGNQVTPDGILRALDSEETARVFDVIYSPVERARFRRIASDLAAMNGDAADVGRSLSGSPVSTLVETFAAVKGANIGAQMGGGGGASIQTANIGANRAREIVRRLTGDKASQLIADAIEDPELFRLLLADSVQVEEQLVPRLLPYLVGSTTAVAAEEMQ